MDAHLRVLLHWAETHRGGVVGSSAPSAPPDSHQFGEGEGDGPPFVWWAKVRSPNRQQPLPHIDDILAIQDQIEAEVETHLYLTDYRSLYVGQLDEITADRIRSDTPDEVEHMPSYYQGMQADFWFRLLDIRRIVSDDTPAVIEELKKLRNKRYNDRPVSLYGGMVELPLIVKREDEVSWFGDRDALLGDQLWAERDAHNRSDTERMMRELRDNLLGDYVWSKLEPATKTFLASAEAVFRTRRDDPGFDFSGPALEYSKALEVELNALVFKISANVLGKAQPKDREVRVDGRVVDLGSRGVHVSLGAIGHLLEREEILRRALQSGRPSDWQWLCGVLPHQLARVIEARNPAAHERSIDGEVAGTVRSDVLGIGCDGLFTKLARMKVGI